MHFYVGHLNIVLISSFKKIQILDFSKKCKLTRISKILVSNGDESKIFSSNARILIQDAKHLRIPINNVSLYSGLTCRRNIFNNQINK